MRRAPSLHAHGAVHGVRGIQILKILTRAEADDAPWSPNDIILWNEDADERYAGSISTQGKAFAGKITIQLDTDEVVRPGDVVRLSEKKSLVSILYRRGSTSNSLFVTEQCNSLCIMCSQPPRNEDDRWRLEELHRTVTLIDKDEGQLGFTGGEPTLLGHDLGSLLAACRSLLPDTHLHVLTNGRLFANPELASNLITAGGSKTVWAVPLYADVASIHDEIVVAAGAFDETLEGLYQFALHRARVEIRIVLHAMSLPRLPQLASFIYRRLPFVEHVAFMGLEPMGFAKSNRSRLWIDPIDYVSTLAEATHHLAARGMNVSIYNLPLCVLPRELWPFAQRSISDWKNVHDAVCTQCVVRDRCAGFFLSADPTWRSRAIAPIRMLEAENEVA
ncbi:MAG: His-Xaa-Ser system radical SAM maturase HxsC [Hyphomonadaceae bacterium]|nr:His-Xaa-Ser system radical SAM maturase HxsC [Hyphomonadaceae bacterium]